MRFLLLYLIFAFTFLQAKERFVYGTNPNRDKEELIQIYEPLVRYLQKELNAEVVFRISRDYDELVDRLKDGTVDFASISPNLYVYAKQKIPNLQYIATDIKKDGEGIVGDSYLSYIVTRKDSNIKSLQDIVGKRIGFKDKRSTSGYLMPMVMLAKEGVVIDDNLTRQFFLKKSSKVMEALLQGSVDVIGTSNHRFDLTTKEYGDVLKVLKTSKPLPEAAFCTSPNLDKRIVLKLQESLKKYRNEDALNSAQVGFSIKDDKFYDSIREANRFLETIE